MIEFFHINPSPYNYSKPNLAQIQTKLNTKFQIQIPVDILIRILLKSKLNTKFWIRTRIKFDNQNLTVRQIKVIETYFVLF